MNEALDGAEYIGDTAMNGPLAFLSGVARTVMSIVIACLVVTLIGVLVYCMYKTKTLWPFLKLIGQIIVVIVKLILLPITVGLCLYNKHKKQKKKAARPRVQKKTARHTDFLI